MLLNFKNKICYTEKYSNHSSISQCCLNVYIVCVCLLDVDFFASSSSAERRRPGTLDMRRCHSTSYNGGKTSSHDMEPTTPLSCDGLTLLSLPLFHSLQRPIGNPGPGISHAEDPMSTSLLARNESWSSFSSLHSLPEPFLCRSHNSGTPRGIPDVFRGTPPVNGWHGVHRDPGIRPAPALVNGYATEEPRRLVHAQNAFARPTVNGPADYPSGRSNDSGTLRASSAGREIDSAGFGDEEKPARKNPASDGLNRAETVRSPSSRPVTAVLGQLVRAKSVTSKTLLRKFGPKFSGSTKSVGNVEPSASLAVKNAVVRRSSSIAQRFRGALRGQQPNELSHPGLDRAAGFDSLRRGARERSPLAVEDTPTGRVPSAVDGVVSAPKADRSTVQRDPVRRVLFGATTTSKDGRKIPELWKNRLSFHGRDRTTSCGDSMTSGFSATRPRSTEPPFRAVQIDPSQYPLNCSSPIMIENSRLGNPASEPVRVETKRSPDLLREDLTVESSRYSSARSPRMASPESSSLSSGSPASVFSAVPPHGVSRHIVADSNASMSDLSLWEMPKLDIDLVDQMFVGGPSGSGVESAVIPLITPTSISAQVSQPATLSVDVHSGSCNESGQCHLSTANHKS